MKILTEETCPFCGNPDPDRQWALDQDPPPIVRERLERGPE